MSEPSGNQHSGSSQSPCPQTNALLCTWYPEPVACRSLCEGTAEYMGITLPIPTGGTLSGRLMKPPPPPNRIAEGGLWGRGVTVGQRGDCGRCCQPCEGLKEDKEWNDWDLETGGATTPKAQSSRKGGWALQGTLKQVW